MTRMLPPLYMRSVLVLAALVASAPLGAQQLYKWVDERGVTNYSNQPPPDPRSARNVRQVEERLSVYTPDPGLTQAIEDSNRNFDQRQRERQKIEALESQLEAERRARQQAAGAAQDTRAAYDRCIADGRIDCGDVYGMYYPPVVVVPPRHRRPIPQAQLTPGATAGNVTGGTGYIPGNSASVPPPPRREAPRRPRDERSHGSPPERLLLERR